jgi:hypothetical protein
MIMNENEKLSFQIKFNVPQRKTHNVNKENGVAAKKNGNYYVQLMLRSSPKKKQTSINVILAVCYMNYVIFF